MQLFVSKNGQRYGPYTLEELRREVLANVFRPEHFASADHGQTWEPISVLPAIGPLEFEVEGDAAQNLLTIRYRGYVRASAVERCEREVEAALRKLAPGFRLLVDFTELDSMDVECAAPLKKIMRLCNRHEVSAVVRVIPQPHRDIGLAIMSQFHYRPEVQIATCPNLEEALAILHRNEEHFATGEAATVAETER